MRNKTVAVVNKICPLHYGRKNEDKHIATNTITVILLQWILVKTLKQYIFCVHTSANTDKHD